MSYRHSAEMNGEVAGWSTDEFKSARAALAAAQEAYGGQTVIYTAWVVPQDYAKQLPPARQLLADMKERAAEKGADVSSFDSLTVPDIATLDIMLRRTIENWEAWLVSGAASKRSSVVIVENIQRHEPK